MYRRIPLAPTAALWLLLLCTCITCNKPGPTGSIAEEKKAASTNSLPSENLTMADVAGEHNPKMIGLLGGKWTRKPWYLQAERSGERVQLLNVALYAFKTLYARFPEDWAELEHSGLFPIRPLDPINGKAVNYGVAPTGDGDFIDLDVSASTAEWTVTGLHPWTPDGTWKKYTWKYSEPPQVKLSAFTTEYGKYTSIVALRGAVLASALNYLVFDYQDRRNEMPGSSDELFDGLWSIGQTWAANDPGLDVSRPGDFSFGLDKDSGRVAASWHDAQGLEYRVGYLYSPWPQGGWSKPPTVDELQGKSQRILALPTQVPEGFIPENILWKCSLLQETGATK